MFLLGIFVGTFIGMVISGLCRAAKDEYPDLPEQAEQLAKTSRS